MKTETIVHAHIVTGKDYLDLVERIESDFWTGEHVRTTWELFGQVDGVILGKEYQELTREKAIFEFKACKEYILTTFNHLVDNL